jgi:hypothetical protein
MLLPLVEKSTICSEQLVSRTVSSSSLLMLALQLLPVMELDLQSMSGRLVSPAIYIVESGYAVCKCLILVHMWFVHVSLIATWGSVERTNHKRWLTMALEASSGKLCFCLEINVSNCIYPYIIVFILICFNYDIFLSYRCLFY